MAVTRTPSHPGERARALTVAILLLWVPAAFARQARTDVVVLANGDHLTGEVVSLDRGRLEFKTDDAGTLYLEWDKLTSVVSTRLVQVTTADGRMFLGSLQQTTDRSIAVASPGQAVVSLPMSDVTLIATIGRSFWKKLDGSFDAGFSYTRSSGIAQLNLNTDTVYRAPTFQGRLTFSLTQTKQQEDERDDRAALEASYLRDPWRRWFLLVAGRFETNESLGLELRSQIGGAVGPRLVNTNRAQLGVGAGIVFNREDGVDVETTKNAEALFLFQTSYYTYDRPKTNLDVGVQYYPSLSNLGRQRLQLDASAKREFWKDLFLALTVFETYDSRPPNPDADTNDVGVVVSIGWTY